MGTGQHPKTPDERNNEELERQRQVLAEIKALTDDELQERLEAAEKVMQENHINPGGQVFMGVKLDATVDLLTDTGIIDQEVANRYFRERLLQSFEMNLEPLLQQIEQAKRQEARSRIAMPNGIDPNHLKRIDPLA